MNHRLRKDNLGDLARALRLPWVTYRVGQFVDLAVDMFICQGSIAMHRHPDEDELFLVYEGTILLGSERGDVTLRAEEAAVVPKGLAHQSSAFLPAVVLLLRRAGDAKRSNGHWRLFATTDDPLLQKVNLGALYTGLNAPYRPVKALTFMGWDLWLMRCIGVGPTRAAPPGGIPLVVMRGVIGVFTEGGQALPARPGDVVTIPPGVAHRLETDAAAMVVWLERATGDP